MAGRRKVKMAGVAQIILLNRAEIWIINIKQGSAGQPIQAEAGRKLDSQIHVLHQTAIRNHLVQVVAEAEAAVEEVVEVEVVEAEEAVAVVKSY